MESTHQYWSSQYTQLGSVQRRSRQSCIPFTLVTVRASGVWGHKCSIHQATSSLFSTPHGKHSWYWSSRSWDQFKKGPNTPAFPRIVCFLHRMDSVVILNVRVHRMVITRDTDRQSTPYGYHSWYWSSEHTVWISLVILIVRVHRMDITRDTDRQSTPYGYHSWYWSSEYTAWVALVILIVRVHRMDITRDTDRQSTGTAWIALVILIVRVHVCLSAYNPLPHTFRDYWLTVFTMMKLVTVQQKESAFTHFHTY